MIKNETLPTWKGTLCTVSLVAVSYAVISLLPGTFELVSSVGDSKTLPSIIAALLNSPILALETSFFFFAFFGLHIGGALACCFLIQPLISRQVQPQEERRATLLFVLILGFWLLLTNTVLYPRSAMALHVYTDTSDALLFYAWLGLSAVLATACALGALVRVFPLIKRHKSKRVAIGVTAGLAIAASLTSNSLSTAADAAKGRLQRAHPDIILIGVDSLRTDHIGYFNQIEPSLTPTLDRMLQDAAVIENAWTPMARTFPSWVSILTGQYPSTHGARFNLTSASHVDYKNNLAHQLGERGYQRLYGIDETRFSNLDASYGFDKVITPAIGASDFLLGSISDAPLVNVIANTQLGQLLFPNLHMNRAVSSIYRPETFDDALRQSIASLDPARPLFLSVHFELPHWPRVWAISGEHEFDDPPELEELSQQPYRSAVARADEQVAELIKGLETSGRMENAILVLLSDHGDAFPLSEPNWRRRGDKERPGGPPRHGGHGTSIVSEAQYRVLLGFRGFGSMDHLNPGLVSGATASLVDIRPTLQDWLDMPLSPGVEVDGISLLPRLEGDGTGDLGRRAVPLETGLSSPSIEEGSPSAAAIVREGAHYYTINRQGRLVIREEWMPFLLRQKQRGAVTGDWILAAIPEDDSGGRSWNLWLANIATGDYWDARAESSLPEDAPMGTLLNTVCYRFASDNSFNLPECKDGPGLAHSH